MYKVHLAKFIQTINEMRQPRLNPGPVDLKQHVSTRLALSTVTQQLHHQGQCTVTNQNKKRRAHLSKCPNRQRSAQAPHFSEEGH